MIILSGYEKAWMAGALEPSCEIFDSEEEYLASCEEDFDFRADFSISQLKPKKENNSLKEYKFRRNRRFAVSDILALTGKAVKDFPLKPTKPDLKRSALPKKREPVKTLPAPKTISQTLAKKEIVLQTAFGNVIKKDEVNKLIVKGDLVGGQYYDNITIEIYDLNGVLINTIRPKTNSGYGPNIMLGDFAGNGLKQIFLGINSGGSGGFGYFYVFDAQNNEIKTLFDYQEFSQNNRYTGEYIDNYKVKVTKKGSKDSYIIDLSLRPKDYLDLIWKPDGKLIAPRSVDISDVNTVFPYYNSATGVYELIVYQRVTGLFNADSLGYVITQQRLENGKFVTFYDGLMVFAQ